jgi:hypothetical protein
VQGVFNLLSHTPLNKLTVSRSGHFGVAPEPGKDDVTPAWDRLLPPSAFESVLGNPVLAEVSARGPGVLDLPDTETVISVQPSELSEASLFLECRYSGSLVHRSGRSSAVVLTDVLKDCLAKSDEHSRGVFTHFRKLLFASAGTTHRGEE